MSKKPTDAVPQPGSSEDQVEKAAPAERFDPQADAPEGEVPEDELTMLRREVDELRDKQLRLLAEQQNQLKRAQRDRQDAVKYAAADFAKDLLVILDDLERTQESAQTATDAGAVADGVRIVYEHFLKVLKSHGIEPIEAEGETFDPSYHEAMLQQPSAEHPAGTVVQQLQRGYMMHDRVLRSSRVIVSSGEPETGEGAGEEPKE